MVLLQSDHRKWLGTRKRFDYILENSVFSIRGCLDLIQQIIVLKTDLGTCYWLDNSWFVSDCSGGRVWRRHTLVRPHSAVVFCFQELTTVRSPRRRGITCFPSTEAVLRLRCGRASLSQTRRAFTESTRLKRRRGPCEAQRAAKKKIHNEGYSVF